MGLITKSLVKTNYMKLLLSILLSLFSLVCFSQREGIQVITSGTSATITNGVGTVFLDMASLAATYTLTAPSTPNDRDIIRIIPGGTITTGTVVTLFTFSANSGQTIVGVALTSVALAVGTIPTFQWRNSTSQWYRLN